MQACRSISGFGEVQFVNFDRWGARVFQTDQIGQGWNGKMQNEGNLMPAGVYIYHLTYQRRGEKESKTTNTVTLLR
ncbi:MAG: gliding motility-associated C-terminal domain-containing protein [Saprospiraceae bacterium]|nr:gliding motility-associated C-terminal domain-containing protein [Saprospiraceae bacterium]